MTFKKKNVLLTTLLVFVFMLACAQVAFAATIADVPNNSLKVGQDVYDLNSTDSFTLANVLASTATGSQIEFKSFNGLWYDLMGSEVTGAADLTNASKAMSSTAVSAFQLRNFYTTGTTVLQFTPAGSNLAISGVTADNLTITGTGSNYTAAVGSNATGAIGNLAITFNSDIRKTTPDDIVVRAYNGTAQLTISNETTIKQLLFNNFGTGANNVLNGNMTSSYSTVMSAISAATGGGSVTKLEFDITSATTATDVLTVTLNLTAAS